MASDNNAEYELNDESIAYGRRLVLDWKDFVEAATTLPNYELKCRTAIVNMLGYLPPFPTIYMPYEPFIRSLIAAHESDRMNSVQFMEEITFCIKRIRNNDMVKHGFAEHRHFTDSDYAHYESHLSQFKEAARRRLGYMLGYEPELQHSLGAEIQLRQLFLDDDFYEMMPPGSIDHRCFTIYHYRKQLVENGQADADNSPLVTFENS